MGAALQITRTVVPVVYENEQDISLECGGHAAALTPDSDLEERRHGRRTPDYPRRRPGGLRERTGHQSGVRRPRRRSDSRFRPRRAAPWAPHSRLPAPSSPWSTRTNRTLVWSAAATPPL